MQHFDAEVGSLELSAHWLRQWRACLEMMKEEVRLRPQEAGQLFQPAMILSEELAATQAALEALTLEIQKPAEEPTLFSPAASPRA
jgi:hypothetical protein